MDNHKDINFETICRVCVKPSEDMPNIFAGQVVDMLNNIAPISVGHADGLPQQLCHVCIYQICKCYSFKMMFVKNDLDLQEILRARKKSVISETNNDDGVENNEIQEVADYFETLCRVCVKTSGKMQNIYEENIIEMLKNVAPSLVDKVECLPKQICHECVCALQEFHTFKITTMKNDSDLRVMLPECKNPVKNLSNFHGNMIENNSDGQQAEVDNFDIDIKEEEIQDVKPVAHKCKICEKHYSSLSELKCHMRDHHFTHECGICKMVLKSRRKLTVHMRLHTGETPYKCPSCPESFRESRLRTYHISNVHSKHSFTCDICLKSFSQKNSLSLHKKIHAGIKPHSCQECGKSFLQKVQLESHFRNKHSNERPYLCTECGRTFAEKRVLDDHIQRHIGKQGPRNYSCTQCDKKFYILTDLRGHVNFVHTEKRPFKCDLCEKTYKVNSRLLSHKRIAHTKNRKHACQHCDKSFATTTILKSHLRTHTGERPYTCQICGNSFAHTGTLATHKKRVHNIKGKNKISVN